MCSTRKLKRRWQKRAEEWMEGRREERCYRQWGSKTFWVIFCLFARVKKEWDMQESNRKFEFDSASVHGNVETVKHFVKNSAKMWNGRFFASDEFRIFMAVIEITKLLLYLWKRISSEDDQYEKLHHRASFLPSCPWSCAKIFGFPVARRCTEFKMPHHPPILFISLLVLATLFQYEQFSLYIKTRHICSKYQYSRFHIEF